MIADSELLREQRGALGLLTLNRPSALNALTIGMIESIHVALDLWADDAEIETVALVGAGGRAFCAGGDILALRDAAVTGDHRVAAQFWREEYRLNLRISRFSKPIVAIQDGIALGGGIGLSSLARFAVATERSRLGLPETGIGFVPDVGGTWLLAHAPGELGTSLALSAASVGAADALVVGLSSDYVPSERIPDLLSALETRPAAAVIRAMRADPGESDLARRAAWIDDAFAGRHVPEILSRLRAVGIPDADDLAATIEAKSPLAVAVTLESIRRARRSPSLAIALTREFRVSMHALASHDFIEGVRAQVIDKDKAPLWFPSRHDDVDADAVLAYFGVPDVGDFEVPR